MIPVGVPGAPGLSRSPAVLFVILACVLVFAWEAPLILAGHRFETLRFAFIPAQLTGAMAAGAGRPPASVTLVTSLFLHANVVHLSINMLFLALFGPQLESRMGTAKFLALFLGAGALASCAYVILRPGSQAYLLGASGAVAGVMGAFARLNPQARIRVIWPNWTWSGTRWLFRWTEDFSATLLLTAWIALQILFASRSTQTHGWLAHLMGFAAGILLVWPMRRDRPLGAMP